MSAFAVLRDGLTLWADGVSDHLCLMNSNTGERIEIPWNVVAELAFSQRIDPASVLMVDAPEYDRIPQPDEPPRLVPLDIEDVVHKPKRNL